MPFSRQTSFRAARVRSSILRSVARTLGGSLAHTAVRTQAICQASSAGDGEGTRAEERPVLRGGPRADSGPHVPAVCRLRQAIAPAAVLPRLVEGERARTR